MNKTQVVPVELLFSKMVAILELIPLTRKFLTQPWNPLPREIDQMEDG